MCRVVGSHLQRDEEMSPLSQAGSLGSCHRESHKIVRIGGVVQRYGVPASHIRRCVGGVGDHGGRNVRLSGVGLGGE